VITSVDVTIFRPRTDVVDRRFLNQVFSTNSWFLTVNEMCGGTTHKRISRGALGRIKILLPDIKEQNKIADILSDMDEDIVELNCKLDKVRNIKQAMSQNLLTGKIRLV
ncbi:MAG: restriction endonuclease subunit S, partial [Flavobacterium sp.]